MVLKLAIPDFSLPSLEWEQSLRLIRDLGTEAVDLGIFAGRSHLRTEELLVFGARMTGGGFGGCTIKLVQSDQVKDFTREITRG